MVPGCFMTSFPGRLGVFRQGYAIVEGYPRGGGCMLPLVTLVVA
jgi:hypothetical protein